MNDHLHPEATGPAAGFVLRTAVWVVGLFALLRFDPVQTSLLIPFASIQERLAAMIIGRPETGVVINSSCTGSDALALCMGAILAFPAAWSRRLAGAAVGFLVVTAVNTVRIANLANVVDRRELFELLHLKVWPAAIILVAAGYVFLWMRAVPLQTTAPAGRERSPLWRFAAPALFLVALYYLVVDRLYASAAVATAAHWAAGIAGGLMNAVGIEASVGGGLLRTAHGNWLVTPACVLTPLLPVYLAAVLMTRMDRRRKALALAAAPLLFLALGSARLLVLAVPPVLIGSHITAVHAFYQLVAALAVVAWAAWRTAPDSPRDSARLLAVALGWGALAALVAGSLDALVLSPLLGAAQQTLHLGHGAVDPQGVLAFLVAFQAALYVAASRALGAPVDRSRWTLGLAAAALLAVGTRIVLGELAVHASLEVPTALLRAWALVVPLALAGLASERDRLGAVFGLEIGHAGAG